MSLTPNDSTHQDDLVYEFQKEIIEGSSWDVNCYLNEEISKPNNGIFSGATYIEVRRIEDHTILKSTRVDAKDKIIKHTALLTA